MQSETNFTKLIILTYFPTNYYFYIVIKNIKKGLHETKFLDNNLWVKYASEEWNNPSG